jgi:O-antigen/teichoic acid export membrane protein
VAFRVVEIAVGVPWLLVNSAFPILARAARDDQQRLRYAVGRLFEGSLIAGGALALGLAFGASFAIRVLGGESQSVAVLEILAGALTANFLVATWSFALLALHRYRALLFNNVSAFFIGIAFTLVLVPPYGATGAAISVTATEVALALMNLVALIRARTDLTPPLRILPPVAIAAAAVCLPLIVLGLPSFIEGLVAPLLFVGVLAALRALPNELLEAARGRQ